MNSRDSFLNEFRGPTLGHNTSQSLEEEVFQNATLRPILKLQNDLIVLIFQNYVNQIKLPFKDFTVEKKMSSIATIISKDIQLQNTLKGIVIGLFTTEEYHYYSKTISNSNKRIKAMLIERLQSQLQLL
ncbi:MAG TPA: glyoxalase [Flavobacterium sp.]|nr:glyoxalase [Flavobacterium sp.]